MFRTNGFSFAVLAALGFTFPAALAAPAAAQAPAPGDIKRQAAAIMAAAYDDSGPGAAAIIARDGQLVYTGARGFADVGTAKHITPDTVFQLGSITKQFTAAVVLQLVAENKLSLDDKLSRFFPDWPQPGANATVRQLLNHTSGIKDFSKIPGWIAKNSDRDVTTGELLALTKQIGSKAEPGKAWEYNNGGYVILGAVIEKMTGKPWFESVEERIARPLSLKSLRYAVDADAAGASAKRYAVRNQKVETTGGSLTAAGAAGGLVASVRDMARWAQALYGGKVVSPALYAEMTSPAVLADGSREPYGMALRLRKFLGHRGLEHGGAGRGIDTSSMYVPDDRLFIAVFANSDDLPSDASDVMRRLAAAALGSPLPVFKEAKIDPRAVEPAFGLYKGEKDRDLRFFRRGGEYLIARGDDELRLLPDSTTRFYSASDGLNWITIGRDAGGAVAIDAYGTSEVKPQHFVRSGPIPADADVKVPAALLQSYLGRFKTETLAVTVSRGENGWLLMTPDGQKPIPMRPVSNTDFMLDGNIMRVVFHPAGGKTDSFTMHRGARELHGKRIAN
jgi:CubicO group peptidase (beta-lactamase class C family)